VKAVAVFGVVLLTACGLPENSGPHEVSPRQTPTVTEPGVTITGYANVGVKRRF